MVNSDCCLVYVDICLKIRAICDQWVNVNIIYLVYIHVYVMDSSNTLLLLS